MVNRMVVGAHYGLRDWLLQRVTATLMAAYVLLMVAYMIGMQPATLVAWKSLFAPQWMKLFTLLFFFSLFYHAWVGVRDVIMDYVKCTGLRLALHSVVALVLVAYAAWAVQIVWGA